MNETDNSIINFFSKLSSRKTENTLSDIIASACNSSFLFKKIFLDFIFPNESVIDKCPSKIEREVLDDNGKNRFDLYFEITKDKKYIIENKIYDSNDHFAEYTKLFPKSHIGFIANYDVSNIKYKNKHTWKDFYKYLNSKISLFSKDEKKMVKGILSYIQGACGIIKERTFSLNDLNDLGYFIKLLKVLLEEKHFSFINKAKGSSEERLGYWTEKNNRTYWFGIFLAENPGFDIYGAIYDRKINDKSKKKYSDYAFESKELGSTCFKLKKNYLDNLSSKSGRDKKLKILKGFIDEIESRQ